MPFVLGLCSSSAAPQVAPVSPGQKPLLPAIRPQDAGKKCIVIDLDETLVHSSFKVIQMIHKTESISIHGLISFSNNRMVQMNLASWAFKAGSNVWDY